MASFVMKDQIYAAMTADQKSMFNAMPPALQDSYMAHIAQRHPPDCTCGCKSPAMMAKMAAPANALTPICTMNDIANQNACGGAQIHVSAATELALVRMQDASILSQYAPGVNCSEVVDGVGEIFARYGGRSTVRVWTARASVGRALLYTFRGLAWLRSHVALALVSGTRFP